MVMEQRYAGACLVVAEACGDQAAGRPHPVDAVLAVPDHGHLVLDPGRARPQQLNTQFPLPGFRAFTEYGADRGGRGAPAIADAGYQGTGLVLPHRRRGWFPVRRTSPALHELEFNRPLWSGSARA